MQLLCGVLVSVLSVGLPDPVKSNNEGKIVGKWESTGGNALPPGIYMNLEFTKEGKFSMTVGMKGAEDKPAAVITGKYTLGSGDEVTLSDLSQPVSGKLTHKETVTIKDKELTMKDADGKAVIFKKM